MKIIDLENKCWICLTQENFSGIVKQLYSEVTTDLTQKELEFFGKKVLVPRLTAWYGAGEYRYSGIVNQAKKMPESVLYIRDIIEHRYSHLPGFLPKKKILNSVLLNFYRDGNDSVDWHSDDESQLGPAEDNVLIASVSFGSARKFVLKNKQTKQKLSFELGEGDVLFMGGQTQKFWQHKIPKTSKKIGERLNLTFRNFIKNV